MQRLALYGGSFDPVHGGHLLVAAAALEELELEKVVFIPTARSPFKAEHEPAPDEARAAMLRLALAGRPEFELDEQELERGGISYSVDTVRAYAARFPGVQLFWLIGADNVATLPKWRDAVELARLVEFIVIPRPGESPVPCPAPFRARQLKGFPFGVSSSQIRARVRSERSIAQLVPATVAEFIRNNRLYL